MCISFSFKILKFRNAPKVARLAGCCWMYTLLLMPLLEEPHSVWRSEVKCASDKSYQPAY